MNNLKIKYVLLSFLFLGLNLNINGSDQYNKRKACEQSCRLGIVVTAFVVTSYFASGRLFKEHVVSPDQAVCNNFQYKQNQKQYKCLPEKPVKNNKQTRGYQGR